jgi:DNA-binding CsgD family transcriptional regulator/tetratricopeptide (TPR) repeat protein
VIFALAEAPRAPAHDDEAPQPVLAPALVVSQPHSTRPSAQRLLGRCIERAALDALVRSVSGGESQALVVRGHAGVGKSMLLAYVAERAKRCRIMHAVGVQSEMELAFAGLQQLCAPLLDRLDRLPAPQRDALATAFGLRAGEAPDRFLVSLAVLSLLGEAAERAPLICLIDDAHWLDRASAQVLAFVARRLLAEPVGLVFASRQLNHDDELHGVPEVVVEGLGYDDACALLESVIAGPLDDRVRDRIIAETAGNPLAVLELPRGRNPAGLAGGFGLPGATPLAAHIEQSFARRLEQMPTVTQQLLLVAAADPTGDATLLLRAADHLGLTVDEDALGAEELITVDDRVWFRQPLVRSAIYRVASAADRRRVHAALADSISPGEDADRRAWHRSHAAAAPDEVVAAELEASAGCAHARGGLAAAAAFLERAVALTPDPRRRAQRALAAARVAHEAGGADAASPLLRAARVGLLDKLERARRQLLEAEIAFGSRRSGDAASLLVAAARHLEPLDAGLARTAYLEAVWAACTAMDLASPSGQVDVSVAVRKAPLAAGAPSPEDLMLDGMATRFVDGCGAGAPTLRRALREFRNTETEGLFDIAWVWLAVELWDAEAWFELGTRQVRAARDAGALAVLPVALHTLASWHLLAGDLALAEMLLTEADSILATTGDSPMIPARLRLAALRGADAQRLITASIREATQRGDGVLLRHAEEAAATLYAGLGRHDEALAWAQREFDHNPHVFYRTALPELVEAAVRCDRLDLARRAVDELCEHTQASGTAWALGIQARSRALISLGDDADALYRQAISQLSNCRLHVESARAQLLYGEWLRRERRRGDARDQLRAAHDRFTLMGAGPFAERAVRELRGIGETARKRTDATNDALTMQEAQIARLAAEGHTNPEIGAQLFLSHRTVEWHLRHVFTKLGLRSRRELRSALPDTAREAVRT